MNSDYQELFETLDSLEEVAHINPAVCFKTEMLFSWMEFLELPVPRIWNHSEDSIVATWEYNGKTVNVTISKEGVGLIIDKPNERFVRTDFKF